MTSRVAQQFQSFGNTLTIIGSISTFLSIIGLPVLTAAVLANNMSEYMQHIPTSATTIFLNILPFYLIGTIVVSIYFIVVGVKMTTGQYTSQQLRGVLTRVTIGSLFWPVVGLFTMFRAITARQDWLPGYEAIESENSNKSQDKISLSSLPQSESLPSIFPKIKIFCILMAVLNILADIVMMVSFVATMITINSNESNDMQLIILSNLPYVIIVAIMFCAHIYAAYLGFSMKKYENDFKKLKTQLIVLGIISVFSKLWILAVIGDVICFSSLVPQYEREQENRSSSPAKPTES